MIIVTSGKPFLDIDAYGGIIAYAELLRLQGHDAKAVSTSVLNESITATARSWKADFETNHNVQTDDQFIIIDLSDPDFYDNIVNHDQVIEIIDHQPGFEQSSQESLGAKAQIEDIGAACTMIVEKWQSAGLLNKMSQTSARLQVCAILDNTLNFKAKATKSRDIDAYQTLMKIADLPDNWPEQYFGDCTAAITSDLPTSIENDSKRISFISAPHRQTYFGQLAVWDGEQLLAEHGQQIVEILSARGDSWMMNIASLSHGFSMILASDNLKEWLSGLMSIDFKGDVATADRLWLRKEVLRADIDQSKNKV